MIQKSGNTLHSAENLYALEITQIFLAYLCIHISSNSPSLYRFFSSVHRGGNQELIKT